MTQILENWRGATAFLFLAIACGLILGSVMSFPRFLLSRKYQLTGWKDVFLRSAFTRSVWGMLIVITILICFEGNQKLGFMFAFWAVLVYLTVIIGNCVQLFLQRNAYRWLKSYNCK